MHCFKFANIASSNKALDQHFSKASVQNADLLVSLIGWVSGLWGKPASSNVKSVECLTSESERQNIRTVLSATESQRHYIRCLSNIWHKPYVSFHNEFTDSVNKVRKVLPYILENCTHLKVRKVLPYILERQYSFEVSESSSVRFRQTVLIWRFGKFFRTF
jgi:hypothetical protein